MGQKIEDKLSELIEEQEAEEARADENDKAKRVEKLTKQWDDVEAELQRVVDNICVYLDGKDEKRCGKRRMNTKYDYCLQLPNITTGV